MAGIEGIVGLKGLRGITELTESQDSRNHGTHANHGTHSNHRTDAIAVPRLARGQLMAIAAPQQGQRLKVLSVGVGRIWKPELEYGTLWKSRGGDCRRVDD